MWCKSDDNDVQRIDIRLWGQGIYGRVDCGMRNILLTVDSIHINIL